MGATTHDAVLGALSVQLSMPGMRVNAYTVDTGYGRRATDIVQEAEEFDEATESTPRLQLEEVVRLTQERT